jgi:hypothetical protein
VRSPRQPRGRSAPASGAGEPRCARAATLAAAALAALLAGCISREPPPPPDTDSTPETAQSLPLTGPQPDGLRCDDASGPDCVDWFRFRPTGPGTITIAVAPRFAEGEKAPKTPTPFELLLTDDAGAEVGRAVAGAEAPVATLSFEVRDPKAYLGSVRLPPGSGKRGYQLLFEARIRTAPAPPADAPGARSRRWTVLEVDRSGGGETSVLIDGGRGDALRPGLRGRLVEGSRTLGRIVVTEVFEEGARAKVEGTLSGTVTAATVAEIEVPADSD